MTTKIRSLGLLLVLTTSALLENTQRVTAKPIDSEDGYYLLPEQQQPQLQQGDMVTVGSLRREARQPAPERFATEVSDLLSSSNTPKKSHDHKKHIKNASGSSNEGGFYKTFGSDADGEKGYLKKTFSKGDHGYKTLDTFHKKLGDRYGFEEHEAFGQEKGEEKGAHHGKSKSQHSKHSDNADHEGAGTDVESHYADDDGDSYGYYEGGGDEGYSGGEGDSSSYNEGDGEGYSESYSSSSNDGDGDGSSESYSSDGDSSSEDSDY